jgi:HK97 family phage major capsid protein
MDSPNPLPTPAPTSTPNFGEQILTQVKALNDRQTTIEKRLDDLGTKNPERTPFIRKGESIMSSRGFQFSRIVGLYNKTIDADNCKIERDLCSRLQNEYVARGFYTKEDTASVVLPLSTDLMVQADPSLEKLAGEIAQIVKAGTAGIDRDEMIATVQRAYNFSREKALSWMEESGLGALVGPPIFGEPIELLRNQEVFLQAGARIVPFPQSGRMVWPRFTGATTGYWVGSGVNDRALTASEPTTGDVVLQVKKLAVLVKIPNELFRFPTVSVEQIIRADMMRTTALKMDKAFLEGTGSSFEPKGIINYAGIQTHTASKTGVDGDTFQPEDIAQMIGKVEEQNVPFKVWFMRPLMYAAIANRRADAVTTNDSKGMFLFNALRDQAERHAEPQNNSTGVLEGYTAYKSNQISKTRAKGSATNLSYVLGANPEQVMVALSGVMEFAVTSLGDTPFTSDQSWIRLITWCDMAPRHEEAFILCDDLVVA